MQGVSSSARLDCIQSCGYTHEANVSKEIGEQPPPSSKHGRCCPQKKPDHGNGKEESYYAQCSNGKVPYT